MSARRLPTKNTQWSYFMQSIEPVNTELDEAFPGFHPMWVVQSQRMDVSAEQFQFMRKHLVKITQAQCAAYMRVPVGLISDWELGYQRVPFIAVELLRLLSETPHFRLSHKAWDGWFINQAGRLVSPDRGDLSFAPADLSYVREIHQAKAVHESENRRLRAEIERLKAENAEILEQYGDDGLLEELKLIETRLAELSQMASKKKIVNLFPKDKSSQAEPEAKCA